MTTLGIVLAASLATQSMFSPQAIDTAVSGQPRPVVQFCLDEQTFVGLLVSQPDIVRFECLDQALDYYSVLKGEGISKTFYESMALIATHVADLVTTKVKLDDPSGAFKESNFLFKDVEGLIILKTGMTATAAVASALRNRPEITYEPGGGATVKKGSGSSWGTRLAIAVNLAAVVNNLLVRK